jgi:hypothetical protein
MHKCDRFTKTGSGQRWGKFNRTRFVQGGGEKFVAIASLYNWKEGGYYTNEYFVGTITDSTKFVLEYRGLLDYGQYYAARTGSASQLRSDRRVLFGATGWHNPQGFDGSCKSQYHLIPRDVSLDPLGRLSFSPLPEIATLHKPGSRTALSLRGGDDTGSPLATAANGSMLELQLNCSGAPTAASGGGGGGVVGVNVLANDGMGSFTTVGYNYSSGRLFVDQSKTCCADVSQARGTAKPQLLQTAPLHNSTAGEGIQLYLLRSILVKRLKFRLSGSARKSQKRFRDTPTFKIQAVLARIQPFQRSNERSERGDHPVRLSGSHTNIDRSRYVLLDHALIEAFANRRAALSSWVGQIMWHDAPSPGERRTFVLPAPAGVECTFQSWELLPLLPPNPGPQ